MRVPGVPPIGWNIDDEQKKKLAKLQQPTAEAIKEQVLLKVESALKKSSKNQKSKGLAHAISKSQKRFYAKRDADQAASLKEHLRI